MKLNNFFLSILFIFAISAVNGQESSNIVAGTDEGITSTSFNWKPFTIELNSSSVGHGIAIEKNFIKNIAFRVGFASDFKSDIYDSPMGYKINFGVMSDVFSYRFLSLKTGIDLGMRKITPTYDHNSGIIGCFFGPLSPISIGFIDIPLLAEINLTENFSFEFGVRTMLQKPMEFSEMISTGRLDSPFYDFYNFESRLHNYHVGLRYTFTD